LRPAKVTTPKPPARGGKRIARAALTSEPGANFVHSAALPWIPFLSEGIHLKLCKVNRSTGEAAFLIRAEPGAALARHYYHGVVAAYTISGRWRHRDAGWIAGAGDVVVEPAGTTHVYEAVGPQPAESFVHMAGAIEFRDDEGVTVCIENAETLLGRYLAHCALHGIEPVDVTGY
jgi:quercetin dioxygenase-like cupin family protein